MSTCALPYHAFAPALLSVTRTAPRHLLRTSSRPSSSTRPFSSISLLPGFLDAFPTPSKHSSSPQDCLRQQKLTYLKDSLIRGRSPSRVWADYTALLNVMGFDTLPLEIHQQVLRQCTPPSAELRVSTAKRLAAGNAPSAPHIHEGRFQAIIRNIRASDARPELSDYHFILEQFAAVGHHIGAMHVYKELIGANIMPQPRTFGLCLQAIAHRMQLPVQKQHKEHLSVETRRMMSDLVREMRRLRIAFTSANLDLTMRILKETLDMETFEELMKWGYGIDLSNPDCPPVEFYGAQNLKADLGMDTQTNRLPRPQVFSTAALNTTIEILGRIGNVSKLVQAFEVLTNPLPRAKEHMFSSFDDDDDFGVAASPTSPPYIPPHATPNTTSYIMLIRHLCTIGHATLARHYINEAMYYDRQKDGRTKTSIKKNRSAIPAPKISVNRGTFLPALGLSNRTKNLSLTRWLTRKLPGVLRRKRYNLEYYTKYKEKMEKQAQALKEIEQRRATKLAAIQKTRTTSSNADSPITSLLSTGAQTVDSPVTSPTPEKPVSLLERSRQNRPKEESIFEIDIDTIPELPSAPFQESVRLIDLDLHIRVLQRDIAELQDFSQRVDFLLGRTVQRVKEGLGRRVWAGKDIYLAHENRRRQVSREDWIKDVNFTNRRADDQFSRAPVMMPDTSPAATRKFFQSNQTAHRELPQRVLSHLHSMPSGE
ncbi:hypothetical protein H0H87_001199 [Tephrocybe sp. NHM501043]|nr:hypothetical protein H0H87_001199 [Tephrocybe sp. NHM501043]